MIALLTLLVGLFLAVIAFAGSVLWVDIAALAVAAVFVAWLIVSEYRQRRAKRHASAHAARERQRQQREAGLLALFCTKCNEGYGPCGCVGDCGKRRCPLGPSAMDIEREIAELLREDGQP